MRARVVVLPFMASLVLACGHEDRPGSTPDGGEAPQLAPASDQLDVLFVIDNSNSSPGDTHLLPLRVTPLLSSLTETVPWVSVHVGIVTTDLGAGPSTPPSCNTVLGDRGILQNAKTGATCATAHLADPAARFLAFSATPDGGVDETNFEGDLDDVFNCYRAVGVGGCGFEHVLGSMRYALDGCDSPGGCAQPANEGFLREAAYLAVIILTDEDDCSAAPDATLFDATQTSLTSTLGPLTSYRCFEFGVLCNGADVGRTQGPREGCEVGDKDPDPKHQLTPVESFADALKALKPLSPRMVHVAVLAGPPAPVEIGLDPNGYPDLQPSCSGGSYLGAAEPGIRLSKFASLFDADRSRFYDICATPADDAFAEIGRDLGIALEGDSGGGDVRGRDAAVPPPDAGVPDGNVPPGATALAVNEVGPRAIAVDDQHVYWLTSSSPDYNALRRVAKTGGEVENVVTGLGCGGSLVLDADRAYFTDVCAGAVLAVSTQPPGSPVVLLAGLTGPRGLAVDGEAVYAGDNAPEGGSVQRAALDGGALAPLGFGLEPQRLVVDATSVYVGSCSGADALLALDKVSGTARVIWPAQACIRELAADDTSLYFIAGEGLSEGVGRVAKAGGDPVWFSSSMADQGLAVDDTYLYWYELYGGSIRRAPKGGGEAEDLVTNHDGNCVRALAVDATHLYWGNNCEGVIYSFPKP